SPGTTADVRRRRLPLLSVVPPVEENACTCAPHVSDPPRSRPRLMGEPALPTLWIPVKMPEKPQGRTQLRAHAGATVLRHPATTTVCPARGTWTGRAVILGRPRCEVQGVSEDSRIETMKPAVRPAREERGSFEEFY